MGQAEDVHHQPHRRSRGDGRIEAPIVANQMLASASAIFTWAVQAGDHHRQPVQRNRQESDIEPRARAVRREVKSLWPRLDAALKLILLTGQRPGEVAAMQAAHIVDGWWQMPGKPHGDWPGTKNGRDHRVALSETALDLIKIHLADRGGVNRSGTLMKKW